MPLSRGADGEVVWSSRPDAGAKFCGHHPRSDGGRKAGHRGEREGNRKTIAQGKPDDPVEPVVLPRVSCCTAPMGAIGTRLSCSLLISRGRYVAAKLARDAPARTRERVGAAKESGLRRPPEVRALASLEGWLHGWSGFA